KPRSNHSPYTTLFRSSCHSHAHGTRDQNLRPEVRASRYRRAQRRGEPYRFHLLSEEPAECGRGNGCATGEIGQWPRESGGRDCRSEEHTSELQSRENL